MQSDTISRSALVAELEAFKMSLGDIVLRFIVDRVIEIVKAHKAVEEAPPESESEQLEIFSCENCVHSDVAWKDEPCCDCNGHDKWVAVG